MGGANEKEFNDLAQDITTLKATVANISERTNVN
jgi:hypothetical protein